MAGWGRRAAGKIDRNQYGQDELLMTLGGQFNVDFSDYDQWTRTTKPKPKSKVTKLPVAAVDKHLLTVGHGHGFKRPCSANRGREDRVRGRAERQALAMVERLKILELRIVTRKKTLEEYIRRQRTLLVDNMKLRKEIQDREKSTNGTVKGLLRKYESFRSGISNLTNLASKEIREARESLEITQHSLEKALSALESEVSTLDKSVQEKMKTLQVLSSYKDKEYPVKAIEIADLKKELEELKINNQEDVDELEHIIKTEIDKYTKKQNKSIQEITEQVTEEAINNMHPSLKNMAVQNAVMKKEVEFHRREKEDLERATMELTAEVNKLLFDPRTNFRQQMFPEFFPTREKCTPDMDVVLDIPVHQWLPI
ncbi:uncharacterized protein C20orf96-like [Liolophura sinensis]|uniref:uncharacterized protein C20orf96-like n=1 Tax=Liolophura sinensis TaxID=3198878 RepID=UPI003158C5E6